MNYKLRTRTAFLETTQTATCTASRKNNIRFSGTTILLLYKRYDISKMQSYDEKCGIGVLW